jgi:molybdopterin-guanine dinucleotide biosynthesis protein A
MAPDSKTVTAVILAGGHSTRFGSDKGLAEWRGRSLVDHVLDRVPTMCSDKILVLREEQDTGSHPDTSIVHDDPQRNEGPLRGVIRGLGACTTEWAWVLACDQPLVFPELLVDLLVNATGDDHALIPEWEGRLKPLTGLYSVRSGFLLEQCSDLGEKSLIGALKKVGYRVYDEDMCRRFDPRGASFLNVNRPEHLALLEGFES